MLKIRRSLALARNPTLNILGHEPTVAAAADRRKLALAGSAVDPGQRAVGVDPSWKS
jgi:hypothetical protein